MKIVPSCSSLVNNYVIPEVEQSESVSGVCIRVGFIAGRPKAFYCLALLGPVSLCTLPLLVLLLPRPLSRDHDVTGSRFLWTAVRVPAMLVLTGIYVFLLHFVSSLLRTQLSLIGNGFRGMYSLPGDIIETMLLTLTLALNVEP